MKHIALLGAVVISAIQLQAQSPTKEFTLSKNGIGPIAMTSHVRMVGTQAELTASARNDTGQAIRRAEWCVQGAKQKGGCAFALWTTEPWQPGEAIEWKIVGPGGKGLPRHSIFISRLSLVTRLDGIRRLFVESIEGSNGALSLDQLKALVTNSGRFELVEDIKLADAVLKGRSEARDIGSTYKGLERGKRSAAVGTIAGLAMGGATSRAVTESKTETLVAESLLLRLTLASGESVWAWDDSLTCTRPKAQCAVAALVAEATK